MEEPIPARQRKPLPRRVGDARAEEVLRAPGKTWRAGRVVEGSGLENRRRGNSTGGSNPSLSARKAPFDGAFCFVGEANPGKSDS